MQDFVIPVYQDRRGERYAWTTLGLGPYSHSETRRTELQVQEALVLALRAVLRNLKPAQLHWFGPPLDVQLRRLRLELTLHGESGRRQVSGLFPLILEERSAGGGRVLRRGYHPALPEGWFPLHEDQPLDEQATLNLQRLLADLDDDEIEALKTLSRDSVRPLSFRARCRDLSDELPKGRRGPWDDLIADPLKGGPGAPAREGQPSVLARLGQSLTNRALDGSLQPGMARSPYREQLQTLLCGARKRPVILCGPPGCGKTTLLHRFVLDLLDADDYPSHRNLDRAHQVIAIAGRRLIAGMSYVGDWQQRCLDLIEDARRRPTVLYVEDLHLFGRLGRSRESESNFAELLRGPLGRGELVLCGEATHEQLQRLEDDAPSFAAHFTVIHVDPTTPAETLRMLLHEGRALEARTQVQPQPAVYRAVLELSSAYFPSQALPGKALGLLRAVLQAEERAAVDSAEEARKGGRARWQGELPEVGGAALLPILSRRTGLPLDLLSPEVTLGEEELRERVRARVIGQELAVEAALDLVMRIKTGLCDAARPCAVYLLTGPTGVGKTEMARCLAEVLFGTGTKGDRESRLGSAVVDQRLLRIDMGEYGGPDAALRLIGDRFGAEGALTRPMLEQPFCVVLLDEIEKAHPQVLHLLLQLFEDGRLTDGSGRTADFSQAVVIMTSNLGAKTRATIGFAEGAGAVLKDVARAVREFFPPELFNRIDRVVPFQPLTPTVARAIAQKEVARLLTRRGLSERNVFVTVEDGVIDQVTARAFDARDGARSVKRYIEDQLGGLLSAELSRAAPAALRTGRLGVAADGAFFAQLAAMSEAELLGVELPLAPHLDLPAQRLQAHLEQTLAFVEGLLQGEELGALAAQVSAHLQAHQQGRAEAAEQLYQIDSMRASLEDFRERLSALRGSDALDDAEELELVRFSHLETAGEDRWNPARRFRLFERRAMSPALRRAGRDELLACLAEAHFLRRALRRVHDPEAHAALVVIDLPQGLVAGRPAGALPSLLQEALRLLFEGERGELDGQVHAPGRILLKRVGLCVRDALLPEHGCHVLRVAGAAPELVRVQVLPAPPGEVSAELLRGLTEGAALLPLVRTLALSGGGAEAVCEVVDYALGFSGALRVGVARQRSPEATVVAQLSLALQRLALLRTGREDQP